MTKYFKISPKWWNLSKSGLTVTIILSILIRCAKTFNQSECLKPEQRKNNAPIYVSRTGHWFTYISGIVNRRLLGNILLQLGKSLTISSLFSLSTVTGSGKDSWWLDLYLGLLVLEVNTMPNVLQLHYPTYI